MAHHRTITSCDHAPLINCGTDTHFANIEGKHETKALAIDSHCEIARASQEAGRMDFALQIRRMYLHKIAVYYVLESNFHFSRV